MLAAAICCNAQLMLPSHLVNLQVECSNLKRELAEVRKELAAKTVQLSKRDQSDKAASEKWAGAARSRTGSNSRSIQGSSECVRVGRRSGPFYMPLAASSKVLIMLDPSPKHLSNFAFHPPSWELMMRCCPL